MGFDAAIAETGRRTEEAVELTDSGIAIVDAKLRQLQTGGAEVTVTHFRRDLRKAGGAYLTSAGRVKRVDPVEKVLLLVDGTCIRFSDILDIDME